MIDINVPFISFAVLCFKDIKIIFQGETLFHTNVLIFCKLQQIWSRLKQVFVESIPSHQCEVN